MNISYSDAPFTCFKMSRLYTSRLLSHVQGAEVVRIFQLWLSRKKNTNRSCAMQGTSPKGLSDALQGSIAFIKYRAHGPKA